MELEGKDTLPSYAARISIAIPGGTVFSDHPGRVFGISRDGHPQGKKAAECRRSSARAFTRASGSEQRHALGARKFGVSLSNPKSKIQNPES